MKRLYLALMLLQCAVPLFAQDDLDEKRIDAVKSYMSGDLHKVCSIYSALDSIEPITYYYDLWRYYASCEILNDSIKSKDLLFRLVKNRGFERRSFNQQFFDDCKLCERPYWPQLDSLICFAESKRCKPFVDSLVKMAELDQSVREEPWSEERHRRMAEIDSTNTAKLQALIAQFGFPTWELVGRDASYNAWLIAQHSWSYLPWYYEHYKDAVKNNNADRHSLAYMEDRYMMQQGRPQLYGTQYSQSDTVIGFHPIADIKNVDRRRLSVDIEQMDPFFKKYGIDSIAILPYYLDYVSNYYVNNTNMYISNVARLKDDTVINVTYYFDEMIYPFPRDLEFLATYWYKYGLDKSIAVNEAKKMVLCGKRLDEEWHLPQALMDSVRANYDELRADYERMIAKDDDLMLNSITSFDTLVKVLDGGSYPRYTIDAWNGHIKELISDKSETLTKNDYEVFFEWLFKQVEVGNYHLFDYAELYDEVYYRLYRKSYFGQKLFGRRVAIFDLSNVDQRRAAIHLSPLRTWLELNDKPCPKGYDWDGYLKEYL